MARTQRSSRYLAGTWRFHLHSAESLRRGLGLAELIRRAVDRSHGTVDRDAQLANRYLRSHPGVDPVDFIIAATAIANDAHLWTRNLKHFPMFEDLTSPY